jgi:DnaJ-class molecular chaperone
MKKNQPTTASKTNATCKRCHGSGKVWRLLVVRSGQQATRVDCDNCHGSGTVAA